MLPAGDQADLGVNLILLKAINHLAPGLLQPFRPVNVVLFIKPGTQLDQCGDIFTIFRSGTQVLHQFCLTGQPINGDADGQYRRVLCSLTDHL